jgi:hypothetical protein
MDYYCFIYMYDIGLLLFYLYVWYRNQVIHSEICVVLSMIKFKLDILTNSEKNL